MKPDDDSGRLPTAQRRFRVLIIAASNRRQYNCPGVDSKARALMLRVAVAAVTLALVFFPGLVPLHGGFDGLERA